MFNIKKMAKEILDDTNKDVPAATEEVTPEQDTVVTSVPQSQINEAKQLADEISELANNLVSEINIAKESLRGDKEPSVLESKDDFKSLFLKLKQMKKKLTLV